MTALSCSERAFLPLNSPTFDMRSIQNEMDVIRQLVSIVMQPRGKNGANPSECPLN